MSEISCQNCTAACCKGPLVMELTLEEAAFMLRGGSKLTTVAQPADHDREKVIHPVGELSSNADSNLHRWVLEPGMEYFPLPAGLGRYILRGACGYLHTSEEGWQYCGAYDSRPKACRDFTVGSDGCRVLRIRQGVDEMPPDPEPVAFTESRPPTRSTPP
jgi:Fe-S-cluster containining protein